MKATAVTFLVSLALAAALPGTGPHQSLPAGEPGQYAFDQWAAQNPGFFFYHGSSQTKAVALTFDDGPDDQATPQILDILKENSVPGTFFLIGDHARRHPDMVRRIVAEGHTIGNHTWSHSNLVRQTPTQARQEINRTETLLEQLTGLRPALVRVPWGRVSNGLMELARQSGWRIIGWSADSFDWRDADGVLGNLRPQIHPGGIILLHSTVFPASQKVTVRILPELIRELKADGYRMVTVDELLHINAYQQPGAPWSRPAGLETGRSRSPVAKDRAS